MPDIYGFSGGDVRRLGGAVRAYENSVNGGGEAVPGARQDSSSYDGIIFCVNGSDETLKRGYLLQPKSTDAIGKITVQKPDADSIIGALICLSDNVPTDATFMAITGAAEDYFIQVADGDDNVKIGETTCGTQKDSFEAKIGNSGFVIMSDEIDAKNAV